MTGFIASTPPARTGQKDNWTGGVTLRLSTEQKAELRRSIGPFDRICAITIESDARDDVADRQRDLVFQLAVETIGKSFARVAVDRSRGVGVLVHRDLDAIVAEHDVWISPPIRRVIGVADDRILPIERAGTDRRRRLRAVNLHGAGAERADGIVACLSDWSRSGIPRAPQTLPVRTQRIVLLSKVDRMTYPQIARSLKISVSTVGKEMISALEFCRTWCQRRDTA